MPPKKQSTMTLEPATDTAPAPDFGALLEATVAEYSDAIEREATQAEHERAEAYCEYIRILHSQDPERLDDLLDIAHRLDISAAKAKADFGVISEAKRLRVLADTKAEATAEWQSLGDEMQQWRQGHDAEVGRLYSATHSATNPADASANALALKQQRESFQPEALRRFQAIASAESRMNIATDAGRNLAALLNSHPELFPEAKPANAPPQAARTDDVPEGFERVTGSLGTMCLRKLPEPEHSAA